VKKCIRLLEGSQVRLHNKLSIVSWTDILHNSHGDREMFSGQFSNGRLLSLGISFKSCWILEVLRIIVSFCKMCTAGRLTS